MVNLKKNLTEAEQQITIYAPPKKFCTNCGAEVDVQDNFCGHCGSKIKNSDHNQVPQQISPPPQQQNVVINNVVENPMPRKDKWTALLLCIFLGFLGAHQFYDGKFVKGIIYFSIFAVFGIFGFGFVVGILVFIDFISILFRPNPYYVGY